MTAHRDALPGRSAFGFVTRMVSLRTADSLRYPGLTNQLATALTKSPNKNKLIEAMSAQLILRQRAAPNEL